jgi:hypothetical protein
LSRDTDIFVWIWGDSRYNIRPPRLHGNLLFGCADGASIFNPVYPSTITRNSRSSHLPAVLDILLNLDLCFLKKVGWEIRGEDVPLDRAPEKEILKFLGP